MRLKVKTRVLPPLPFVFTFYGGMFQLRFKGAAGGGEERKVTFTVGQPWLVYFVPMSWFPTKIGLGKRILLTTY